MQCRISRTLVAAASAVSMIPVSDSSLHHVEVVKSLSRDRRLTLMAVVATTGAQMVGMCVVGDLRKGAEPSRLFMQETSKEALGHGQAVRFVGVSSLAGPAVWIHPDLSDAVQEEVAQQLVVEAVRQAWQDGRRPVPLLNAAPDVQRFVRAGLLAWDREPCDARWYLELNGATTLPEFLASLTARHRRSFVCDAKDRRDIGLTATWLDPTDPRACRQLVPLVGEVQRRNGFDEHESLTQFRLSKQIDEWGSEARALHVQDSSGGLLAGCLSRVRRGVFTVGHLGLCAEHPRRREIYSVSAFLIPLERALFEGCRILDLGRTHAYPKKVRGATGVDLFRPRGLQTSGPR